MINQHVKAKNIILILFLFLSMFSYFNSVNTKFSNNIWVYVLKESKYGYIAKYKNMTVYLNGDFKKLSNESLEGKKILIKGKYEYKIDGFKGVLGNFKVDTIIKSNYTLNYHMLKYKTYLYERFKTYLSEKNSSYVMALVFGEDKFINQEEKDDLKYLGILHVLSVSGFHMVLIFGIFNKFFNAKFALFLTFCYLLLTGIESASLRAFIMIFIAKMAGVFYRNYNSKSALYFACLVILILNPFNLFNIGFLLSFGATLGILMYQNDFSKLLPSFLFKLNQEFALTLSAQVFILPILFLTFGGVNTIFLFGNILLIPFYTVIIYLSCLMFILLNFNLLTIPLARLINLIFYSLDGAKNFLFNIDMPVLNLSSKGCFLYICIFILITSIRLMPKYKLKITIIIFIAFISNTVKVFPEVTMYLNSNFSAVLVEHLNDKYLFANFDEAYGNKVSKLKGQLENPVTITNFKKIHMSGGIFLSSDRNLKSIAVSYRGSKLITPNLKDDIDYDIIKRYQYKYILGKWCLLCMDL